jgi:hypothetical protein
MNLNDYGPLAFGLVLGWVTYRTLRRTKTAGINDIASVFGAVGGAAVTGLFSKETAAFGLYCIGLAIGFFCYLFTAVIVAHYTKTTSSLNEWLGEGPPACGKGSADTSHKLPGTAGNHT